MLRRESILVLSLLISLLTIFPAKAMEEFEKIKSVSPNLRIERKFNTLSEENKFTVNATVEIDKSKFTEEATYSSIREAVLELLNSFYQFKAPSKARRELKFIRTDGKKVKDAISPEEITINSISDDLEDSTISIVDIDAVFPLVIIPKSKLSKKFQTEEEPVINPPADLKTMRGPRGPRGGDGEGPREEGDDSTPPGEPGNETGPDGDDEGNPPRGDKPKKPRGKGKPGDKKEIAKKAQRARYKFKVAVAKALLDEDWTDELKDKIADKLNIIKEDIQIEITADSEEGADDGDNEEESNDDENSDSAEEENSPTT
ncbi:MAG: hypothetical protein HRT47_02855 [Candidatus Caenarcaniphilales bacterium]|nr:hypothetical protein [Candidatus Caenarcaniphilales bacterium]